MIRSCCEFIELVGIYNVYSIERLIKRCVADIRFLSLIYNVLV